MRQDHPELRKLNEALNRFEEAITAREHRGMLRDKTPLQQEVDRARSHVVTTVVEITKSLMKEAQSRT